MTMERYDVLYTRNNLSKLLARAEAGEEIEITRRGRPVARLVPIPAEPEYFTGKTLVEWLEANPLPEHLRKTRDEIDAVIAELDDDEDDL